MSKDRIRKASITKRREYEQEKLMRKYEKDIARIDEREIRMKRALDLMYEVDHRPL